MAPLALIFLSSLWLQRPCQEWRDLSYKRSDEAKEENKKIKGRLAVMHKKHWMMWKHLTLMLRTLYYTWRRGCFWWHSLSPAASSSHQIQSEEKHSTLSVRVERLAEDHYSLASLLLIHIKYSWRNCMTSVIYAQASAYKNHTQNHIHTHTLTSS